MCVFHSLNFSKFCTKNYNLSRFLQTQTIQSNLEKTHAKTIPNPNAKCRYPFSAFITCRKMNQLPNMIVFYFRKKRFDIT